jgi:hypothetical protein
VKSTLPAAVFTRVAVGPVRSRTMKETEAFLRLTVVTATRRKTAATGSTSKSALAPSA